MVNKTCPFKKVLLCVLPNYRSEEAEEYRQMFRNIVREAFENVREVNVEFSNTIDGVNTLPNQLLLSLLLQEVAGLPSGLKLSLVTTEKKMMNMYRFQMMKTDRFRIQ